MPFERKPSPITFWTIAGAVMLGILMADAVRTVVMTAWARWELREAISEFNKNTAQAKRDQEEARQIRADADAKAAQARQDAVMQAESAQRARAAEAARKEAAWKAYYQPAPICNDPPDSATFTKCANDHLRAKKQFEATYRPQKP